MFILLLYSMNSLQKRTEQQVKSGTKCRLNHRFWHRKVWNQIEKLVICAFDMTILERSKCYARESSHEQKRSKTAGLVCRDLTACLSVTHSAEGQLSLRPAAVWYRPDCNKALFINNYDLQKQSASFMKQEGCSVGKFYLPMNNGSSNVLSQFFFGQRMFSQRGTSSWSSAISVNSSPAVVCCYTESEKFRVIFEYLLFYYYFTKKDCFILPQ